MCHEHSVCDPECRQGHGLGGALPVWRPALRTPVPGVLLPPGARLCFQVAQLRSQAASALCCRLGGFRDSSPTISPED